MKRGKTAPSIDRQTVLRSLWELAVAPANDAVQLAFLEEDAAGSVRLEGLDLRCLTEFKRSNSGAVELRLADRAGVLVKLLEQLKEEENAGPAAFLQALERSQPPEQGLGGEAGGAV